MARPTEPFSVIKRPRTKYWYYKLGGWTQYRSSGKTTKSEAFAVALEALEGPAETPSGPTLRKYVEPFFVWETCPHVKRLVAEGENITHYHVRDMRSIMENHLLSDPVVKVRLSALKRSHILDYRERLLEKLGYTRTVQKAVGVLKTILKEAYFREEISRDPTVGIGSTRYQPKEIGVFTAAELKTLFPAEPPGPWGDLTGYTVFLMAATTGMRRGEILALTWACVDFNEKCIEIRQAWKDRHEIGPPKWGKTRVTPMPEQLVKALERYRAQSSHAGDGDLVFSYDDGERIGNTWWAKRFTAAMKKTKIDREKRNIRRTVRPGCTDRQTLRTSRSLCVSRPVRLCATYRGGHPHHRRGRKRQEHEPACGSQPTAPESVRGRRARSLLGLGARFPSLPVPRARLA